MPTVELHRRYERSLLLAFCVVWGWLAIAPIKRSDWLAENLLVIALLVVLVTVHRQFIYGLLLAYPLREALLRVTPATGAIPPSPCRRPAGPVGFTKRHGPGGAGRVHDPAGRRRGQLPAPAGLRPRMDVALQGPHVTQAPISASSCVITTK